MAVTYEPIASTTLGADAASIEFTSIPGTYDDLVLVMSGYTAAASLEDMRMQVNSDTANNYSFTQVYNSNNTTGSNRASSVNYFRCGAATVLSTDPAFSVLSFMSYSNTNVFKTVLSANGCSANVVRAVALWRSTSAITSVKMFSQNAANLKAGFTAALYGIKAA